MINLTMSIDHLNDLSGRTLEERAKLILCTLGRTPEEIHKAYRKMSFIHHPDKLTGDADKFKLVNEAYKILIEGKYPKRKETSLLADDRKVIAFIGKRIEVLDFINAQTEFEEYERWHGNHFYGVGVI
jgi:curved DNA-binding protein CbpA